MRKIVMFNRITLDGFFAGPNEEIDWFIHDNEVDKVMHERMQPDTLLLGRLTYQMFESYWPNVAKNPNAPEEEKVIADELTEMTKLVFSTTLEEVNWENTELIKNNIINTVKELKQGSGADITIFGSGTIVQQLANEGLIDEYLIVVTPVVLGTGKPLFKDDNKFLLKLLDTRSFITGNVLLHYKLTNREAVRHSALVVNLFAKRNR
jgi:dihydrofolate reductase